MEVSDDVLIQVAKELFLTVYVKHESSFRFGKDPEKHLAKKFADFVFDLKKSLSDPETPSPEAHDPEK